MIAYHESMTKPSFVRDSIVKGYLNGKSYAEISNENNIAKGSVFNIINTWIAQIGIPDIEEIREFSIAIRKSGITIKQCAQSFRFIQILARFGITDELDSTYFSDIIQRNRGENEDDPAIKNKKDSGWKKDQASTPKDDFYYFIETIYNYCKRQGIRPANVIKWIQDLIDFSPLLYENVGNNTTGFERDTDKAGELQNLSISKKPLFRISKDIRNEKEIQIPFIS